VDDNSMGKLQIETIGRIRWR